MDTLTTYENMDALAAAIRPDARDALVAMWRRMTWGLPLTWHRGYVRDAVPPLWRDLLTVTTPDVKTLNRWEQDHGYVSR